MIKNEKILVVDDNKGDHFLNKAILKRERPDIEIYEAYDGEEALKMVESGFIEPDLILLDINMPRMNGHEFLEAYSNGGTREIPVVVMLTSSAQEDDKEKASAFSCVKDYLVKPMTKDKLEALESLLANLN